MSGVSIRSRARRFCEARMERGQRELSADELAAEAIVLAPHPDDETLGCGGTILRKRRLGARVSVVFMTDGRASHRHLLSAAVLASIRTAEARAACATLGVDASQVVWLGYPDHELERHASQAVARVRDLLASSAAAEIFVPHRGEQPADHRATREIALAALARPMIVNEYPIWLWRHWPWCGTKVRQWWSWPRSLCTLMSEFNASVDIQSVIAEKRAALAEHRSQMTRLVPGAKPWPTLSDVAGGDFLNCFFRAREIFRRYRM